MTDECITENTQVLGTTYPPVNEHYVSFLRAEHPMLGVDNSTASRSGGKERV